MIYAVLLCSNHCSHYHAFLVESGEKEEENKPSQKIDDLHILVNCRFGALVMFSSEVNGPVAYGST